MRTTLALATAVFAGGCTFYSGIQVRNNTDQTLKVYSVNYTDEKEVRGAFADNPERAEKLLAMLKSPDKSFEEVAAENDDPEQIAGLLEPKNERLTATVWKQVIEPGKAGFFTTYCSPPSSRNCDRLGFLSDRPWSFLYQMDEFLVFSQDHELIARLHRSKIHPTLNQLPNSDPGNVPTLTVDRDDVTIEWLPGEMKDGDG